jgi:hypothetical protein
MRRLLILTALVLTMALILATLCPAADVETFNNVKIHRHKSLKSRVLVDKSGVLTFDDTNKKFTFRHDPVYEFEAHENVEVGYDSVTKVVFEVTTHMRGGAIAKVISFASIPGVMVGNALASQHVHDYWFYCEYKNGEQTERVLLEVPKSASEQVISKATRLFGSRVKIDEFKQTGEEIDQKQLPDRNSEQSVRVDHQDHPLPEVKADKATVVVVCPPLAAREAGKGNQFKLHAKAHVVAVNREGTYSFAYLDPGKYRLVSQSENANGFEMELQAGETYYLLQNTFMGVWKGQTMLSRNSEELVMYLLDGSYFSDWKNK